MNHLALTQVFLFLPYRVVFCPAADLFVFFDQHPL